MTNEKINALIASFEQGFRPVVRIRKVGDAGGYLESGMVAKLARINIVDDELVEYIFDFTDFLAHNKQLETASFFNTKNGEYDLTATEYGYSHNGKECCYTDINDEDIPFDILDNPLFDEYMKSEQEVSYLNWLESMVGSLRESQKQ